MDPYRTRRPRRTAAAATLRLVRPTALYVRFPVVSTYPLVRVAELPTRLIARGRQVHAPPPAAPRGGR
jgi:hypothetical protein